MSRHAGLDKAPPPSLQEVVDEEMLDLDFSADESVPTAPPGGLVEPERLELRVPVAWAGKRIDQWLVQLAPGHSRNHLQQLIADGCASLNGQPVTSASRKLQAGQVLDLELRLPQHSQAFTAEPMDLQVVFEDEHLLVVDKPAGLVVHPAPGNWQGTLMNGLLAHHAQAVTLPRAGIVHRLDKDTSGLMVVGKTLAACTALVRAIAAREVHRQYRALVWGLPPAALRIEAPIGRDPVSRIRMAVLGSGRSARTDVRSVATAQAGVLDERRAISAVECTLHTGRTHQIRVHLSSRGWPLLADKVYGGLPALGLDRQALHAASLAFEHPILGTELAFQSDLPQDLASAWWQVVHNEAHPAL